MKIVEKSHHLNNVDVKRSFSRCFCGPNLHSRVAVNVLCTLPPNKDIFFSF